MRRETLEKLMAARREGRPMVRALHLASGEERLLDPAADTSPLGQVAAQVIAEDASRRVTMEGGDWFLTAYGVPWEIVIIGAVHIAQALAALAVAAGYRVRVIDPRAPYATQERFPGIGLQRAWPDEALATQPLTSHSAVVALAHDPKLDDEALVMALRSPAFYVGALGSVRTHARRLARLRELGLAQEVLTRIHGPVGLAIGARSPAEIAIAILAEMVEIRRAKPARRIAGIVLAAGTSSRMGRNKLVEQVRGKPLVRHAVDAALAGGLDPVVVVTGHEAEKIRVALAGAGVSFVSNPQYDKGLSTSLKAGIAAVAADCDGAMILLGDMPDISAKLVGRVIAAFDPASGHAICAATGGNRRGHPVLWARSFFPRLTALTGDTGARDLLEAHAGQLVEVEAGDDAPLTDIDTPEALLACRQR